MYPIPQLPEMAFLWQWISSCPLSWLALTPPQRFSLLPIPRISTIDLNGNFACRTSTQFATDLHCSYSSTLQLRKGNFAQRRQMPVPGHNLKPTELHRVNSAQNLTCRIFLSRHEKARLTLKSQRGSKLLVIRKKTCIFTFKVSRQDRL